MISIVRERKLVILTPENVKIVLLIKTVKYLKECLSAEMTIVVDHALKKLKVKIVLLKSQNVSLKVEIVFSVLKIVTVCYQKCPSAMMIILVVDALLLPRQTTAELKDVMKFLDDAWLALKTETAPEINLSVLATSFARPALLLARRKTVPAKDAM